MMRKASRLLSLLMISVVMLGMIQAQPATTNVALRVNQPQVFTSDMLAGFDSPNITVSVDSPINGSVVSGVFDITVNITSDYGPVNHTLYIDDLIDSDHNQTIIGTGIQAMPVNTTSLAESLHNFTILFMYNSTGIYDLESVYLEFTVHNPDISASLVSPEYGSVVSGVFDITVNIVSVYGPLNHTLFIDGEIDPDHNQTVIGTGVQVLAVNTTDLHEGLLNFTILFMYNSSGTYDRESVYLEFAVDNDAEALTADIISPVPDSKLSGPVLMELDVASNYGPINFTLFIEEEEYDHQIIDSGLQYVIIDTTDLREGLLNFTLHFWYNSSGTYDSKTYQVNYIIDNDASPLTVFLVSPTVGSTVSGTLSILLDVGSDYGPVNVTLYVDGEIDYPDYDNDLIDSGIVNVTIDTLVLSEGELNFTFAFEYNSSVTDRLEFNLIVDNHGVPNVVFISPTADSTLIGIDDFTVNITTTYSSVYVNVTVDGALTTEYNQSLESPGELVCTINSSRYENGYHNVSVLVWTEEGLEASTAIRLFFLDYIRFEISGLAQFSSISGYQEMDIKVYTPFDDATMSVYYDATEPTNVIDLLLDEGTNTIHLNVTSYPEGLANFTFIMEDEFGHEWTMTMTFEIDNHGYARVEYVSPRDHIVVGYVTFTISVTTTWEQVNMTVYVDDIEVLGLVNVFVGPGDNTFSFDVAAYSKYQHTLKIVLTTPEGLVDEYERDLGFATIRIEEVISLVLIAGIAFLIPIYRWRKGQPLRPVIIVDTLFVVLIAVLFVVIGVNSLSTAVWHFNLSSIWTLGSILVFTNWIIPLVIGESEAS
ncbi:MAG: hypothetical protein RTU30_03840 [Candidatus Thorarchaeota archaeon]